MRFAALIPLVTLSGLAAAAPAHLNRPVKHLPDAIAKAAVHAGALARLQHHPKRALLDVCATLDARVLAGAGLGGLLGAALGARADLCLCVSAFPLNVEAVLGVGINTLTNLLGLHSAANIDAALLALVNEHGNKCAYPTGASPICSASDPCGFSCPAGRMRAGNACVCAAGTVECNGTCQRSCASAVPRTLGVRKAGGSAFGDAKNECGARDMAVCGVYNSKGFECIDVKTNLESCGACAIPHPFLPATEQRRGADCTTLPGVTDVSCAGSACIVRRCAPGWHVAQDGHSCIEVAAHVTTRDIAAAVANDHAVATVNADVAHHPGPRGIDLVSEVDTLLAGTVRLPAIGLRNVVVLDSATHARIVAALFADVRAKAVGTVHIDALIHASLNVLARSTAFASLDILADADLVTSLCADVKARIVATAYVAAPRALLAGADNIFAILDVATHDRLVAVVVADVSARVLADAHVDIEDVIRASLATVTRTAAFVHLDILAHVDLVATLVADVKSRIPVAGVVARTDLLAAARLDGLVHGDILNGSGPLGLHLREDTKSVRLGLAAGDSLEAHHRSRWGGPADWAPESTL